MRTRLVTLTSMLLLTACLGTETGNPFTHKVEPTGALASATPATSPPTPDPPTIEITGEPGSVNPASGRVFAWGLENNVAGIIEPVAPDGSFGVVVQALPYEIVRLQVRAGPGEASPPLDLFVAAGSFGYMRFNTALSCLRTEPELALQLGATAGRSDAIVITNHCDMPVTRTAARARESGFTIDDDGRMVLGPGEQSTIRVTVVEGAENVVDNVVFSLNDPVQEIRAITVGTD